MDLKGVLSKVFAWMFVGLMITFFTGYIIATNPNMLINVLGSGFLWICIILEFVLVIVFSARKFKMKPITAKICFLLYAFVSGLTFSSVFVVYELTSVIYVFLITAIVFGVFALIGHKTNKDLSKFSTYLLMGLLAIIICTIINLFLQNNTFDLIVSIVTILIFIGFTAYDIQRIKFLSEYNLPEDNLAIYGALELYLDFINLFLEILNLFGKKND